MLRPRITPCLLIHDGGLVKTVEFKQPKYVGDPINAVKIFNEKEADELIVLDIDATVHSVEPDYKLIANLAAECRMPLCYGGGVKTAKQAKRIIGLGVEKVAISSAALANPGLVSEIADAIGRQSVVVVLDVRKTGLIRKHYEVWSHNATKNHKCDAVEMAQTLAAAGAGEIVVNAIELDGRMGGYDVALGRALRGAVNIPISVLGGAGSLDHISELVQSCGVIGAAAGSLFVFKGKYRAVLINYPNPGDKEALVRAALLQHDARSVPA